MNELVPTDPAGCDRAFGFAHVDMYTAPDHDLVAIAMVSQVRPRLQVVVDTYINVHYI